MENDTVVFECICDASKKYKLTFDGGKTGQYSVEVCENCYKNYDMRFLISEEIMEEGEREK